MRLPSKVKQELIDKINNGISINKISKNLNLAKSTIYYYYKKEKGKKYQPPRYQITFSEQEGEIVGIFAGDGSQNHSIKSNSYLTRIHFGNVPLYANYVKNLFETYFNKNVNLSFSKRKQFLIRISNKETYYYFKNYILYESSHKHDTVKLITLDLPEGFIIGFLKGFLDTDGCISISNNQIRIIYTTTSEELAYQINFLLKQLNIESNIRKSSIIGYKDLYRIQILSKSFDIFLNKIYPFKINNLTK